MFSGSDPVLLSTLAAAYGSPHRARIALDGALGRAALDNLPSAPGELASFFRIDLHAIIVADVGPVIAEAVTEELLSLVGYAEYPTTRAMPQRRPRDGVSVMLVRIDRAEESKRFDLSDIADRVFRVRYPLPACVRMRVTRPLVVIVGSAALDRDLRQLEEAAQDIDAEMVELGAFVARAALHDAIHRAVARARSRRGRR